MLQQIIFLVHDYFFEIELIFVSDQYYYYSKSKDSVAVQLNL